ncbi:MAG: hypothetical protein GEU88_15140 [Solirubrobacterales bacterium]|nr:hypothetical protein [Solirubrobacterales bacterium]
MNEPSSMPKPVPTTKTVGGAIALAALAALIAAGIGTPAAEASAATANGSRAQDGGERAPALKRFRSCDPLRTYLRAHRRAVVAGSRTAVPLPAGSEGAGAAAADAAPQGEPAEPQTNVQEEGVDEPDIVKSDGETIFALADGELEAVAAGAESPALLGSLALDPGARGASYDEAQLLLLGDRALVMATSFAGGPGPPHAVASSDLYAGPSRTVLIEVDVADPTAMRVLRTMTVDGSFVSARLTGATARVVVDARPELPIATRGHGRAWMPAAVLRDREAGERTRTRLVGCSQVSRARRFSGAGMLTVLTIDMKRGLPAIDVDAVMSSGEIVYASPTSLYVATERWLGVGPAAGRSSDVDTQIHQFDASDPAATTYLASGRVDGFMLSQWSLSEHEGVLRVASTTSPPWVDGGPRERSQSFITALARDGARLAPVGRIGGLGEGEQIYAVRFIGEIGYVVTFRQVDPLHVVDLSDPTAPALLGELEVPGYSAYLHPVGEGLLLGVGQDADDRGTTRGVQVSLFDVSDPARPARLDVEALGRDTQSEVEYDHHAFFYSAEHRLAVIPIESYASEERSSGAAALRVDPGAADPIARLAMPSQGGPHGAQVRRTLAVGDRLFTVSARGIAAYDPETLAPLAYVAF